MKKKFLAVFAALFAAAAVFAGCQGTYVPPKGDDENPSVKPGPVATENSRDFTVKLKLNDEIVTDSALLNSVKVTWSDGYSQPVTSSFSSDGTAKAEGLDGDYLITLTGLPEAYSYDPNGNYATNYNKSVEVEIYNVITVNAGSSGTSVNSPVRLRQEGVYRATIQSEGYFLYYIYTPTRAGLYTIKSLVDVTENFVNPKYQECFGTEYGVKTKGALIDGGGAGSTHTTNFKDERGFNYDEIGNIILFGVTAETRDHSYPVTFEFLLKNEGEYVREDIDAPIIVPAEFEKVKSGAISEADFRAQQQAFMRGNGTAFTNIYGANGYINGELVGFNEATGYYHLIDTATGKPTGPVICAKITSSTGVLGDSFSNIEYHGNKALTIDDNFDKFYRKSTPKYGDDLKSHYLNYKVFIEGYRAIARHDKPGDLPGIATQFAAYKDEFGYADFVDENGVYPVTEELKRFLQGYSCNAMLFYDGDGVAEEAGLKSSEEDQWLFACGYYK